MTKITLMHLSACDKLKLIWGMVLFLFTDTMTINFHTSQIFEEPKP